MDENEQRRKLAEFDQQLEGVRQVLPAAVYSIFKGLIDEGFYRHEAFELARDWMEHLLLQRRDDN